MSDTPPIKTTSISFGGPTIFVQAPDGLWGEFALPDDKRVENGDEITIFECRFLGVLYREVSCPERPAKDATEEVVSKWKTANAEWRAILKRDDLKLTMASGRFVTLLPLEAL